MLGKGGWASFTKAPVKSMTDEGERESSPSSSGVWSSPTMTFNEGRQTLAGNVGYRVVEANVRELIRNPHDQASWC